jgi:ABC-type nitrate/sulfonate/bicarbonate transport system substrate-binding protein
MKNGTHAAISARGSQNCRRMNKKIQPATARKLRLGFVPLTDCAPLVMAHEFGLFQKFGLSVQLSRELGWATVRDKVVHGELDAAHALAAMPLAATLGLGSIPCECLTALVLNQHGNAITLSADLWKRGARDGKTLREEIVRSRREKIFTFGVVFPFSSHRHLFRKWLSTHGIDPERDVRFVVVPPPQMVANLKAGHLDGFCVGEPWNSLAVHAKAGWIAATSAELDSGHPEKVLMARSDFAAKRNEQHLALVAALREACEFCEQPENRARIAATLARPEYVGVPQEILKRGLAGQLDCSNGVTRRINDFFIFHRDDANEPSGKQAAWALQLVQASGLCPEPAKLNFALGRRVFRTDLFEQAKKIRSEKNNPTTNEKKSEPVPV